MPKKSPKRSPKRSPKSKNDRIYVYVDDDVYEYSRSKLIHNLEHGPIFFASIKSRNAILKVLVDLAKLSPGNMPKIENFKKTIYQLVDRESVVGYNIKEINAFIAGVRAIESKMFVTSLLYRLLSVYRLYPFENMKGIYLTVNSLDLLRNNDFNEYELLKIKSKDISSYNGNPYSGDVCDIVPIGTNIDTSELMYTKQNKNAFFATDEIDNELTELIDSLPEYKTERDNKDSNPITLYNILYSHGF